MEPKVFLFNEVRIEGAKVSAGPFVGVPSLTALTGLAQNFALKMAAALALPPGAFESTGALLAIGDYKLHEGYIRTQKLGNPKAVEAAPFARASFEASIGLELTGTSAEAHDKLPTAEARNHATSILRGLTLAKGQLRCIAPPVTLAYFQRGDDRASDRVKALRAIPSRMRVLVDYSYLMEEMRDPKLPDSFSMMEAMLSATIEDKYRVAPYQEFFRKRLPSGVADAFEQELYFSDFESEVNDDEATTAPATPKGAPQEVPRAFEKLVPVHNGYLFLSGPVADSESAAASTTTQERTEGVRLDEEGRVSTPRPVSPVYTLVRLQSAASVRARLDPTQGIFWSIDATHPAGFIATAAEPGPRRPLPSNSSTQQRFLN